MDDTSRSFILERIDTEGRDQGSAHSPKEEKTGPPDPHPVLFVPHFLVRMIQAIFLIIDAPECVIKRLT